MAKQPFQCTDSEAEAVIRSYQDGMTANAIARHHGFPYAVVRNLLTSAGFRLQDRCGINSHKRPRSQFKPLTLQDRARIEHLYNARHTAMDIAKQEGLSYAAVREHLQNCGYYLYSRSGRKQVGLTDATRHEAELMYRQMRSIAAIASALAAPRKAVRSHLEEAGLYQVGRGQVKTKGNVTDSEKAEMVRLFQSGLSAGKIAKQLERATSAICRHLAAAGIELVAKRRGLAPERKHLILHESQSGKNITEIARATGHSTNVITKVLRTGM